MLTSSWLGLGRGHGHLRGREVEVSVRRGGAPARRTALWLPGVDHRVSVRDEPVMALTAVRAG